MVFISWVNDWDKWEKCVYRTCNSSTAQFIVVSNKKQETKNPIIENLKVFHNPDVKNIGEAYNIAKNYFFSEETQFIDKGSLCYIHQDAMIIEPNFVDKMDLLLSRKEVGLIGFIGTINKHAIPWWSVPGDCRGRILQGEAIAFWNPYDGIAEYIDAFCMVTKSNIDFSEEYKTCHFAADMDYCRRIHESGKQVRINSSLVCHLSGGIMNKEWEQSRETFKRIWNI